MNDRRFQHRNPLDDLTSAEREVLLMLARGHTAKTIASSLGLTVAAVNERLRAARRRTGAGSSRELARRLLPENRDEFSGAPARAKVRQELRAQASGRRRVIRRTFMITSALLAATAAVFLGPQLTTQDGPPPGSGSGPDAEIVARLSAAPSPQQLRARLTSQSRDLTWAEATEAGIRQRYGQIPTVAGAVRTLSVTCAATLCEVVGRMQADASSQDAADVIGEVQSGELNRSIEQLGLRLLSAAFTADPDEPGVVAFVSYHERTS